MTEKKQNSRTTFLNVEKLLDQYEYIVGSIPAFIKCVNDAAASKNRGKGLHNITPQGPHPGY